MKAVIFESGSNHGLLRGRPLVRDAFALTGALTSGPRATCQQPSLANAPCGPLGASVAAVLSLQVACFQIFRHSLRNFGQPTFPSVRDRRSARPSHTVGFRIIGFELGGGERVLPGHIAGRAIAHRGVRVALTVEIWFTGLVYS